MGDGTVNPNTPAAARRDVPAMRFMLTPRDLSWIDAEGRRCLGPARYDGFVGGSQPDSRSATLPSQAPLQAELALSGDPLALPY